MTQGTRRARIKQGGYKRTCFALYFFAYDLTPPLGDSRKQRGRYAHERLRSPLARRAGWAGRRFDSPALSEVPGVVLCLCAKGEGTFLHIARYEGLLAPRIGAQLFLANQSFTTLGYDDHLRQCKARLDLDR